MTLKTKINFLLKSCYKYDKILFRENKNYLLLILINNILSKNIILTVKFNSNKF